MGNFLGPASVLRRPTTIAAGLFIAGALGLSFIARAPSTGQAPTGSERAQEWQSGSGRQIGYIDDTGRLVLSGAVVSGGVTLSTGATLTQVSADSRYVNTSGDTMTGALNVLVTGGNSKTIGVVSNNTISGAILYGYQGHFHDQLTVSGSLTVRGSMSGTTLYGKRCPAEYAIQYTASGTALAVNSGTTLTIPIAYTLSGYSLSRFTAIVDEAGVTGLTRFALRNTQKGKRQLFSTNPSIDTAETSTTTAATAYVIDTANDDVSGGDTLSFDILQIQTGTAPEGLKLYLEFSCP